MLYAAYAGNLDPDRMAERAPRSPVYATGWLPGWRLTFGGEEHGWDGPLATVVEAPDTTGAAVYVVLYEIAPEDEALLDGWEGAESGLFQRITVRVQTLEGEVPAFVYVLDAYEGGLPSASYLGILAEAAEAADAPDDYVAALRARPCRSIGH